MTAVITDDQLYVVRNESTGEMWSGYFSRTTPKLYTKRYATQAKNHLNRIARRNETALWQVVPVSVIQGLPLPD